MCTALEYEGLAYPILVISAAPLLQAERLLLCKATSHVMRCCLELLGIAVIKRM